MYLLSGLKNQETNYLILIFIITKKCHRILLQLCCEDTLLVPGWALCMEQFNRRCPVLGALGLWIRCSLDRRSWPSIGNTAQGTACTLRCENGQFFYQIIPVDIWSRDDDSIDNRPDLLSSYGLFLFTHDFCLPREVLRYRRLLKGGANRPISLRLMN